MQYVPCLALFKRIEMTNALAYCGYYFYQEQAGFHVRLVVILPSVISVRSSPGVNLKKLFSLSQTFQTNKYF